MNAIRFDERGFGLGGRPIRWDELTAVGMRTTAEGPFLEDVYWQFLVSDGLFELPGLLIDAEALAVMQTQLAGIDSLKIVSAMGSTSERIFCVWHAESSKWRWDDAVFGARFAALIERLGGQASRSGDAFRRLRAAWSTEERRYHNCEHLTDCLRELDGARVNPDIADVAELALWYHDAIYEPRAHDCEERSAAWLCEDATALGVDHDIVLAAAACIRATTHVAGATTSGPASQLVVDIDLSILGGDALRFMDFEYAVAEEYACVPPTTYHLARGHFLAERLKSPPIFHTDHFRERYEANARANIAALLRSPRYRIHRWFGRAYRWFR